MPSTEMSDTDNAARSGVSPGGFQYVIIHVVAEQAKAKQVTHDRRRGPGIAYHVYHRNLQRCVDQLLCKRDDAVFQHLEIVVHPGVPELAVHLRASAVCCGYDASAPGDAYPPTVQARLTAKAPCVLSEESTLCDIPLWEWTKFMPGTFDQDWGRCQCKTPHKVLINGFTRPRAPGLLDPLDTPDLPGPGPGVSWLLRAVQRAWQSTGAPPSHSAAKPRASVALSMTTQATAAPAIHVPRPATSSIYHRALSYEGSPEMRTRVAFEDDVITEEPTDASLATTAVDQEDAVQGKAAWSASSASSAWSSLSASPVEPPASPAFIKPSSSAEPTSPIPAQSQSSSVMPLAKPKKSVQKTRRLPASTTASSIKTAAVVDEKPQMCDASTQTPPETSDASTNTSRPPTPPPPQPIVIILPILYPFAAPSAQPSPVPTPGPALVARPAIEPGHTAVPVPCMLSETDNVPDPPEVDLSEFEMEVSLM